MKLSIAIIATGLRLVSRAAAFVSATDPNIGIGIKEGISRISVSLKANCVFSSVALV